MQKARTAKLFRNGASQAVRLPAEFRFPGDEVYIRRHETTGEVILSTRPGQDAWDRFFALRDSIEIPKDFMSKRPMNQPPENRNLFGGEK